jgi:small GTP-binding protein
MSAEITNLKVTFLGDSGTGKSSIINQYVTETFNPAQDATIGASYFSRILEVKNKMIRLSIWDTAGQEKFESISSLYSRNSDAFILVCDAHSPNQSSSLKKWYQKIIEENLKGEAPTIIAINKIDLVTTESETYIREVEEYADNIHATVIKTSAKDNQNIKELFDKLLCLLISTNSLFSKKSITLTSRSHSEKIDLKRKQSCCRS